MIHIHWWSIALPICVVARARKIHVVITEHGSHWPRRDMRVRRRLEARLAYWLADRVVVVSAFLRDEMRDQGVRTPLEVVPNVVDDEFFRVNRVAEREQPTMAVIIARLRPVPPKGVEDAIAALALHAQRGGECVLDVVGDGPLRDELERLASDLGVADRVRFLGELGRPAIVEALANASFLVSASRSYETFGVVIAEAMAAGVPVLATRVGAVEALVGQDAGVLVEPGNVRALADGFDTMLQREWDSQSIRRAALPFTASKVADRFLNDIYQYGSEDC